MKLFFETSGQWNAFLITIPIGFLLALGLHGNSRSTLLRFVGDFGLMLTAGIAFLALLLVLPFSLLRLYATLGLIVGAILYLEGLCRIQKRIHFFRQNKIKFQAGTDTMGDEP